MIRLVRAVVRWFKGLPARFPRVDRAFRGLHSRFYIGAFVATVVLVLFFQAELNGFIRWHHGYVSAHNLAIITSTTLDNSFAGYAFSFRERDRIRYEYFRRSPAVLIPLQYAVTILPFSSFRNQMYASFQFMNVMYLLSLWLAFCIMRRLLPSANHAMAVVLVVFSNYYLMTYRDMLAPDNLTLLGILLIVYGAMDSVERARRWVFYLCAVVGSLLGWGVASLPVLGFWCMIRCLAIASWARFNPKSWFQGLIRLDALWAFLLCVFLVGGAIGHTVWVETELNNLTYERTSIAGAVDRRSDGPSILRPMEHYDRWVVWSEEQIYRVEKSFYPFSLAEPHQLDRARLIVACVFLLALGAALRRWDWKQRSLAVLLAVSGVLWLLVLTDHAKPHEYSAVTFAGIPLVVLGAALFHVPRMFGGILLIPAAVMFGYANLEINEWKEERVEPYSWMADEFQTIAALVPEGSSIYYDRGHKRTVRFAPYAIGYFLNGRHVTRNKQLADFAISKNRRFGGNNLTPHNKRVFLFSVDQLSIGLNRGKTVPQKRAPTKASPQKRAPTKASPQKRAPTKASPDQGQPAGAQVYEEGDAFAGPNPAEPEPNSFARH